MRIPSTFQQRWTAVPLAIGLVVALTATLAPGAPASAASATPTAPAKETIRHLGGSTAVADSYLVVFKDTSVETASVSARADTLAARVGARVARTYRHALRGFELAGDTGAARRIAADPSVAYVEQNHRVRISGTQTPTPSWGLDRIDRRPLALDNSYTYPTTGAGVRVYILDTGIRFTHTTFGGRAVSGFDAIDGGPASDCHGHGTHVAGTAGGTIHGVAKGVTLVGVRVLDCDGGGTTAQVVAGIDWVTGDHDPGERAVANMSLGGPVSTAMNTAVVNSIADGVSYAVAAGNDNVDACGSSPAAVPAAITVAATGGAQGGPGRSDARASFSSHGSCVDIFAPGVAITSSTITSDTSSESWDGTSMASPHVAGAAALVLAQNPSFTPLQVRDHLVNNGTTGLVTNPGTGSPNVLLYVADTRPPAHDFAISVAPAAGSVPPGGSVSTTVSTRITAGSAQTVTLGATGLPAGVTASFSPAALPAGRSSVLTLRVAATTPPGVYPLTITGTSRYASRLVRYTLTVTNPPGCVGTNNTDVEIPDLSTAESAVAISGCPGRASASSSVRVRIVHTFRSDLVVSLVAPDGSAYVLHNQTGGGEDNIDRSFPVNLSSEVGNGRWRLRVQDRAGWDVGHIDTWTVNLGGNGPVFCSGSNGTDLTIPDPGTVQSTIALTGCSGVASRTSEVAVVIPHGAVSDLVLRLVAPDGSSYLLRDRTGGFEGIVDQVFVVDLSRETRNGSWRLRVQDTVSGVTGYLDVWSLTL
ncbi:S8 family peptidase [Plantactinospora soyae]|uniref:Subtilisin family serine protease/subtilisin-like proprotein convertase family protein n=1 Tax=Plantactinospora soyae TaxID=1544732 RepID=A0A927MFA8_9ACTN|nr:S8 family peptidase [Plantactinospora soyae]MBE1492011.1 subtilisin family serine protease/subtilisin-like proprotein convertase family protein [Plantactinospora soyae]